MIINTGKRQYKIVRDVFLGTINDVYICKELNTQVLDYKTVWMVKDKNIVKKLLQDFDTGRQEQNQIYIECFTRKDNMCFTFPYYQERSLDKFYLSTIKNGNCSREQIWMDLIVQCMTCDIPEPFLQMIFTQNQIQLSQDGAVHFNYALDLSQYDAPEKQKSSVILCAKKIITLIQMEQNPKDEVLRLLERKLERSEYSQYIQLYKDMKLLTEKKEKNSVKDRAQKWYVSKKDTIYHVLSRVSMILVIVVLFMLVMRLIFGDFAIYRLFDGPIKQIGTESLLQ